MGHQIVVAWLVVGWMLLPGNACAAKDHAGEGRAQSARELGRVLITLKPQVTAGDRVIRVVDVASLQGGSATARARIASLDLNDALAPGASARISAKQIQFRLRMANIRTDEFQIQGPGVVVITAGKLDSTVLTKVTRSTDAHEQEDAGGDYEIPGNEILQVATKLILRRLPGKAEDIRIRPAQALAKSYPVKAARHKVQLAAEMAPAALPHGLVKVDVNVVADGLCIQRIPVNLEVKLAQWIAIALKRIEAGDVLNHDNVRFDKREIDWSRAYVTSQHGFAGKKAKRMLLPGQLIAVDDVEEVQVSNPILVKSRDLVKIVARLGNLKITALGEALQEGRAGQFIKVQNVKSKSIVLGRVIDRAMVEVEQ